MMVAAGLLAQKAAAKGLAPKPWVKTILAPGSRATELMLKRAGLTEPLFKLGFFTCGFGCMSCIGNSGDIHPALHAIAGQAELTSVLSGNRNFDGRISPDVAQNFLCQPALVVAYAIAGTMDVDLSTQPVGTGADGHPVYLAELMPTNAEIQAVLDKVLTPELFQTAQADGVDGSAAWQEIPSSESPTFPWDEDSTYVRRAPYFDLAKTHERVGVKGGRALAFLGDFVTTDHISPAGSIAPTSPAARYLRERGVDDADFNTYGARRGNHEVMMRGTFANVRLENFLAGGKKGGWTLDQTDGEVKSVFDASESYRGEGTPLFFSRPAGSNGSAGNYWGNNVLGAAGDNNYKSKIVAQSNFFRNAMVGESTTLSNPTGSNTLLEIARMGKQTFIIGHVGVPPVLFVAEQMLHRFGKERLKRRFLRGKARFVCFQHIVAKHLCAEKTQSSDRAQGSHQSRCDIKALRFSLKSKPAGRTG